ncbi:MAG: response regulator transcription factor [Actinobacteria bacterium]|nr:response regulator transcription factor [Actinomycetota bacterium]MBV8396164.1 response regulator transcription factor [Actinomycetota bacterium]
MTSILLVDDEPSLVRGLKYALEREDYDVVVAEDGLRGAEAARSRTFDLVLLDVMMPHLSGIELCRLIRAESDVPIIMLTAKDAENDLITGLESGADDYVTKPFSAAVLLSRIRALLRRRALEQANGGRELTRVVGGISIDLARDEVEVDGRPVSLTPSEFKILALLAAAPNVTHTREEIMEHLWGSSFIGDAHTCEVHISSLRKKIERDPRVAERLVTVRGVGYLLRA